MEPCRYLGMNRGRGEGEDKIDDTVDVEEGKEVKDGTGDKVKDQS